MSRLVTRRGEPAAGTVPARALFLVGGYDGSGNYGDLLLARAAIAVARGAGTPVLVLERAYADRHDANRARWPFLEGVAVAYLEDDDPPARGFTPADLGPHQSAAATYLYGGGYLNARWGERKFGMVRAADELAGRELALVSSGLQIEPEWARAHARLFARAQPVGIRDQRSELTDLECALTGDDAVGVITGRPRRDGAKGAVNVHLGAHPWVTSDDARLRGFVEELVAELGLRARPVVAYHERQRSEAPAAERLGGDGLVLEESTYGELAGAELTVACSFHVALTSLLLGVPAALVRDSAYYEQKAAGLLDDFELPDAFSLDPASDPAQAAAALRDALAQPGLRTHLAGRARALRERRGQAERALVERLREASPTR